MRLKTRMNYHIFTENREWNLGIDKIKDYRNKRTTSDLHEYYQIYQHNEIPDLFIFLKETINIEVGGQSCIKSIEIVEGQPVSMRFYYWENLRLRNKTLIELGVPVFRCGPDFKLNIETYFSDGESFGHYCMEKIAKRLGLDDIDLRFERYIPQEQDVKLVQ